MKRGKKTIPYFTRPLPYPVLFAYFPRLAYAEPVRDREELCFQAALMRATADGDGADRASSAIGTGDCGNDR